MINPDIVIRWIRRLPGITLSPQAPHVNAAEIGIDATTGTLQYLSNSQHEAVALDLTQTITGNKTLSGATAFTGATAGVRDSIIVTADATYAVTAAMSGTTFICTRSSTTQVFTLPAAVTAGLRYSFVAAHADSEIRLGVFTADNIVGKTSGAENGTGLVSTATTGQLLNTAAGNVVGDFVTVVSDGITTWYMRAVAGAWTVS